MMKERLRFSFVIGREVRRELERDWMLGDSFPSLSLDGDWSESTVAGRRGQLGLETWTKASPDDVPMCDTGSIARSRLVGQGFDRNVTAIVFM